MPTLLDTELARVYADGLVTLADQAGAALARRWVANVTGISDDDERRWLSLAAGMLDGAALASSQRTAGYLGAVFGQPIGLDDIDLPTLDLSEPFISARTAIRTVDLPTALDAGASRAEAIGRDFVTRSADATVHASANSWPTLRAAKWQRKLDGDACDWCRGLAAKTFDYDDRDLWRRHRNCGCRPVAAVDGRLDFAAGDRWFNRGQAKDARVRAARAAREANEADATADA